MKCLRGLALAVCMCSLIGEVAPMSATEFYVSPAGSASGDGTVTAPWDLSTALSHPKAVSAGDTIWLRGGMYRGTYTSYLTGSADAPIIVRGYPGERAVIDGSQYPQPSGYRVTVLTVFGGGTWYWGFEIMNSDPRRTSAMRGSNPPDTKGFAMTVWGPDVKVINLVIHDNGGGIGAWAQASHAELYGNIIYYNGWDSPSRSDGHAIYANNSVGQQIADNICASNLAHGLHVYGAKSSRIANLYMSGNISFQNGGLSKFGFTRNLLVGNDTGGYVVQNTVIQDNYTYYTPGVQQGENNVGYGAGCAGVTLSDNYMVGGVYALDIPHCEPSEMTGNTIYGAERGVAPAKYPDNSYYFLRPTGIQVFVRPNKYEPGRGHIVIYNWDLASAVFVDISGVLAVGDSFEVRDAQNYLGQPVVTGTYDGGWVLLPMDSATITPAIGDVPVPPVHTGAEFGAFVILRTSAEITVPADATVAASPPDAVPKAKRTQGAARGGR